MASYMSNVANSSDSCLLAPRLAVIALEFHQDRWHQKTTESLQYCAALFA